MTRRSLLAAGAGAVAAGALRPAGALAQLARAPEPLLRGHWLGRVGPQGTSVELAHPADLVGLEWRKPAGAQVWLRFLDASGHWSGWVSAATNGHAPDEAPARDRDVGDPVWTGGTRAVQVRSTRTLSGARLRLVDVSDGAGARRHARASSPFASLARLPLATPVLAAGPGQPPIIAREAWADGMAPPRVAPEYGAVQMAFVHHTDNPNGYTPEEVPAMVRAIYVYHRYVRGWNDIGYNFVIDLYGRIFEARAGGIDEPVVGAQAGGYNLVSTGIAMLGTFTSVPISSAARRALEALLAWKLSLHGVPAEGSVRVRVDPAGAFYSRFPAGAHVLLPRIAGHREADTTDCPGDVLYGELPAIRSGVRRLAPNPTRVTIALVTTSAAPATPTAPPEPSTPEAPGASTGTETPGAGTTGETLTLAGSLELLGGSPIAGAPILVQARTVSHRGKVVNETRLGETSTDAEGKWSLPVTPSGEGRGGMWLRAVCPGGQGSGATVSEALHLREAVSLTAPAGAPAA